MKQKFFNDYGMVLVLLALCLLFSLATIRKQSGDGPAAVKELVSGLERHTKPDEISIVAGAANTSSEALAQKVAKEFEDEASPHVQLVVGSPRDLRLAIEAVQIANQSLAAIAVGGDASKWRVLEQVPENFPEFANAKILIPSEGWQSNFLKGSNLIAVVDRIVVIAVIAIGMTLVIITGGIDLSVGSLIAFSAVISTLIMKKLGGLEASAGVVLMGYLGGVAACGLVGAGTGGLIARFKVAPFIVTLGVMMIASGLAFKVTGGFSIYQVPKALPWLGQGRTLGLPNTVLVLIVLYVAAHIFMTHTRLGRYIYAVGGNAEAARLSGVPVKLVTAFVYVVSGIMAGIGGCIQASQVNTGTPTMGEMYELYVIAAVVVGGTSLSGGSGRIIGTLIGAFIIAVIQNGMNLLGIDAYTQKVVLGSVIIGAVLLDRARQEGGVAKLLFSK